MKITTLVNISEKPVTLISQSIRLEIDTPARGILNIKTDEQIERGQLVEVAMQLGNEQAHYVFVGFIESITPSHTNGYQILVRELAALLNRRVAISLQHCTAKDIVSEISAQTGAHFVLPDSAWTKKDLPRYQHIGGGYSALDYLLRAFDVQSPIWQQQPNGTIYVGELEKSLMGSKAINIESEVFSNIGIAGGELPTMPRLRPGIKIKINGHEKQIASIDINNEIMRLGWVENLHDEKLRGIQ